MRFFLLLCVPALLLSATLNTRAADRPPTVDPSYGMPVRIKPHAAPRNATQWIWTNRVADNQTIYLRREFNLPRKAKLAVCYITADNLFSLYINGKELDHSSPEKAGFEWKRVHAVNIAPFLNTGSNLIAVKGLNLDGPAGVAAEVVVDGKTVLYTDKNWKALDSSSTPNGWMEAGYNDAGWAYANDVASLTEGPWAGELEGWPGYSADVPYLSHITLQPVAFLDIHNGSGHIQVNSTDQGEITVTPGSENSADSPSIVVDFGKEVAGRIRLDLPQGTVASVGTGESEDEATISPWGGIHNFLSSDVPPYYTPYSAFRYAKISFPYQLRTSVPVRIRMDFKYYPVRYLGSFSCSDPLLTRIWYTGAYTAHLCMQEDIWDAPKRDRARWMGDLQVSGRVIDTVFLDKFLMEQTMRRLRRDAQGGRSSAELPISHVNGIPGYSAAWIVGLTDFIKHTGDMNYLRTQHDLLTSMISYIQGEFNADNLFSNLHGEWCFVDWSPDFNNYGPLAQIATQMYFIKAAKDAAFLYAALGDSDNVKRCRQLANVWTAAAQAHFLNAETDTFGDRRQENAMAIFAGAATPKETSAIYNQVFKPGSPAWNQVATPYYNNYIIYAMSESGHTHAALNFIRDYWGGMITEGATSFWEGYDTSWEKDHFHLHLQADNGTGTFVSLSHGWSSGPTSFLTERVLGIRSTGVGFKTVTIAPELAGLKWAEGTVPTPEGSIHLMVRATDSGEQVTLDLPKECKAELILPGHAGKGGEKLSFHYDKDTRVSTIELTHPGQYRIVTTN